MLYLVLITKLFLVKITKVTDTGLNKLKIGFTDNNDLLISSIF